MATPAPKLISPPADYALDLETLKDALNVDYDDKDDLLKVYLAAAIDDAEKFTGRAFVDQTWDVYFDAFPSLSLDVPDALRSDRNSVAIPKAPLIDVVGVFYQNDDGSESEFTDVLVDSATAPARLYLPVGGTWPTASDLPGAIRVRYRAGYVDYDASPPAGTVPAKIQSAIVLYVKAYFDSSDPEDAMKNREAAQKILRDYRIETGMA